MLKQRTEQKGLYHIRLLRNYIEYLQKYYPQLDLDEILDYAGLTRFQLDDPGYWYTQEQADSFHKIINEKTKHPNISREVGKYSAISSTYGTIRQYIYGFFKLSTAYSMLQKICTKLSKGMSYTIRMDGPTKMEAISIPAPGVHEKPYQCENRLGMLEALAMPFTGEYAKIEHPECYHHGGQRCRYIVSWHEPLSLKLKRYRNIYTVISFLILTSFLPLLGFGKFSELLFLMNVICILSVAIYISHEEKKEITERIQNQSIAAELLMEESNRRNNEAQLVHEIGQAISKIIDIDDLLETVMSLLENHLDFQRGLVLLANRDNTRLLYRAGFGYSLEHEMLMRGIQLHLDRPDSKGPLVLAFKKQIPYLINNVDEIINELSDRSRNLVELLETSSLICIPIIYENESLGVLSVDNTESKGPPKQSDLNLLMGIAPQIAISINNARTFEKMQASEEKYRVLVESANSIILRINTRGEITFANRFAQEFYGHTEPEMLGRNIMGLIVPEKDLKGRDLSPAIHEFLKNPEAYNTRQSENIRKNGDRVWVSWSNKAIYDKDGNLAEILCVGSDITARKKTEYEKKQLEAQLVRAQKMEAIGALAGGVAHDLNNILSGITSYPELLLMEIPVGSPMRKAVQTIKKSGEKAAAIVQDLLTLARRGVSVSSAVDLNAIVRDYFDSPELSRLKEYHPHINFEIRLDDELKYILGSEVHLGKTLMNLVSNAAEAMHMGGTVIVSTCNKYLEKPLKGYDTVSQGEYVVLSVADTGVGISENDMRSIFEPFFSKKIMGRSGTGLGMTVVWSTVKDHNGYIDVESQEGKGTRFDLYFPITRHIIKENITKGSIMDYPGTEHILVVDDAEEQREITKNLLKKLGYQVDVARSGEEAVEIVKQQAKDLVILDMIMDPGIDGLETYKRILAVSDRQKAIIVSGFSETERVREALKLGVGGYIRKPYALGDLARAVRTELDRQ
jgi:PAS domain S-box-containing protein